MIKLASIIAGVALVLVGLIVFPLPIPFGAIMIVSGLVLLVSTSGTVARYLRAFRRRYGRANFVIQTIEDRLPQSWKKALQRSDP